MVDYSNFDIIIPKVVLSSKELESFLMDFMLENVSDARGVIQYIGLVMIRLGFKPEDRIELRNFNGDCKDKYFQCVVNGSDYYDMRFENVGNKKQHTKITLVNFNKAVTYECFPLSLSELGVRVIPVREEIVYADGIKYIREYSRENAKYIVSYFDYQVELDVVNPKDVDLPMYDNNGNYSRYRVDNEEMLVSYLSDFFSLWNERDIVKIYKNICSISLGNDLRKYGEVTLKCLFNDKVTDLIHLKSGELEHFGVTLLNIGRTLFLNKDGSWSYGFNDENNLFTYSMNVNDHKTEYNIEYDNNIDSTVISEVIESDTDDVLRNIDNVKKLVRKLFNNIGDSN